MSKRSDLLKLEQTHYFKSTFDHKQFKDKILLITTTRSHLQYITKTMNCLLEVLSHRPDAFLVIIDNDSESAIGEYLETLKHPRIDLNLLKVNYGRAVAHNSYFHQYVNDSNLPRVIFSVDPDITFSVDDFDRLIDAVQHLPRIGMLGMRYVDNACNPERGLSRRPREMRGTNGQRYNVSVPLFNNVAGGIFALRGEVVIGRLKGRLFPKSAFALYLNDDGALHDALRRRLFVNGYLEGTLAKHWKSGDIMINDESP